MSEEKKPKENYEEIYMEVKLENDALKFQLQKKEKQIEHLKTLLATGVPTIET